MKVCNLLILATLMFACKSPESTPSTSSPNIVFLLVDDLGWNDVGCYGSIFHETPNIDQLAREGMRFTDAYAAASICSPTRASMLTGKYPARLNLTDWLPGMDPKDRKLLGTKDVNEMPLEEYTLAEALKDVGYATGFFGKWHLGDQGFFPEDQGFDVNKGGHWAGQPASYFYPYKNERKHWDVPGLEGGKEGEYLTDRLTTEALQFIEKNKERPFLLYFAYYNVHTPIQAKPELVAKYEAKKEGMDTTDQPDFINERENHTKQKQDNPAYAGMVQSVDESVGRIMQYLQESDLADNTVIVFTSDNGGLSTLPANRTAPTSVVPLRAGKGWLYEGGIRVPLIVKWPGVVQPGSTSDFPVISTDYYPTLLSMTGISFNKEQAIDGEDLVPLLKDGVMPSRSTLYWHFPHYHGSGNRPSAAIRVGDYKLIEWFENQKIELYDLKQDLSEKNDLAEAMPDKAAELRKALHDWRKEVGALMPEPNPDYEGEMGN